jgi:FkbM family methyltransferase
MLAFLKIAGQWDDKVIEALLRHIDERAVVYDIGANAGYYSLCFAAGRPQARLFAFEPIPMLAKGLATSAKLNDFGHLRVFQAVLSDRTGETTFYLPRHAIHASLVSREADAEAVTVPSFRLDDVIASGDLPPPDAIKMDVEGAEMMVLAGAADTLTRHKPVICYEADENSERFGHRPGDVIRKLQQFGYTRFCKIEGGGERLIAEPEVDAVTPGDFLAFG